MTRLLFGIPILWRAIVGLIFLAISTIAYFGSGVLWPYGWLIGGLLLAFSIPSRKTHDWGEF